MPGVSVNPVSIGRSLIVLMLIPLAIGLFTKARYAEIAAELKPHIAQASSTSLIAVFVLMLTLNFENIIGVIGSRAILAAVLLIVIALAIGYYLAPTKQSRSIMGLGTAERNIAAAMVVADGNFRNDPNVLTMILVGALLMLSMMMLVAGEFGKRVQPSETE